MSNHNFKPWTINLSTGEYKSEGAADQKRLKEHLQSEEHKAALAHHEKMSRYRAELETKSSQVHGLAPSGVSLRTLFTAHIAQETIAELDAKTMREKNAVFAKFMEVFGAETDVNSITGTLVATKWTPLEALLKSQKNTDAKLSGATLEKRRGYLSKAFAFAEVKSMFSGKPPFAGRLMTKAQIKGKRQSYAQLDADQLRVLFSEKYPREMNCPDWFWIPLLGLFSGARLGELCGLTLENVKEVEGVKCMHIRLGKNNAAPRRVPVHSALLKLGFWDYVEALKSAGETRLLPHRPSSKVHCTKSVGRQWGLWIKACGITDDRVVFHSFRSTAITDFYAQMSDPRTVRSVVGHTPAALDGAHGEYARGQELVDMRNTVEKLAFPTIDFSNLVPKDPTFRAFFENDKAQKSALATKRAAKSEVTAASNAKNAAAAASRAQRQTRKPTKTPPAA